MKQIVFIALFFFSATMMNAQVYFTKTGIIKFDSKTSLENIKAENRKVVSVLNSSTGALEFSLLMKGFDFTNQLMEDHFNESYVESDKFPKASFKGSVTNISTVNFTKDGTYSVNYTGKLTIKDITKDISGTASIEIKGGKVTATSKLQIKPKDYNIVIPATAAAKIAEFINVEILMDYTKK